MKKKKKTFKEKFRSFTKDGRGIIPCLIVVFIATFLAYLLIMIFPSMGNFLGQKDGGTEATEIGEPDIITNECITPLYPNITDKVKYAQAIDEYIPDDSPLNGLGEHFVAAGGQHGIHPAFIVAIARKESSFGKHVCTGSNNSFGRTASSSQPYVICKTRRWYKWDSWQESLYGEAEYLKRRYIDKGLTTIKDIMYTYAPPSENDTEGYIKQISSWINNINELSDGAIDC